jgi:hypothetical protein
MFPHARTALCFLPQAAVCTNFAMLKKVEVLIGLNLLRFPNLPCGEKNDTFFFVLW